MRRSICLLVSMGALALACDANSGASGGRDSGGRDVNDADVHDPRGADAAVAKPDRDAAAMDAAAKTGDASASDAGSSAHDGGAQKHDAAGETDSTSGAVHANQGGTVIGDSSTVMIPGGALTEDTRITIEPGTNIAMDGDWRFSPAGDPVRFGPSGTMFAMPVTVTLTFDPTIVGDHSDLFVVAHRDDDSGTVSFLHPAAISGWHVSVPTTSFSTFQPTLLTQLMTGVVRDRGSNQPIAGAQVFFYGSGYGSATTDAQGEYNFTIETLTSFGGGLSGTLYAGADGYFEAPSIEVPDLGSQPALPVVHDLTLLPSVPLVHGVITDLSSGMPVAGATVSFSRNPASTFRGGATTVSVTTANDGSYDVDASYFAESSTSSYSLNLMINASGYLGVTKNVTIAAIPQSEDFALLSSTGSLMTGVVRDRNSHAPIAGAKVFFYGSGYGTVTTDANGAYTFSGSDLSSFGGGLSGTLYVGADGYFEAPSVSVSDLASQPSLPYVVDVSLLASGPLATGVVTAASDGMPIAGATISFNRNPMSTFRGGATTVSVTIANDGSYAIDASYFAESSTDDYSVDFMVNATGFLGASRNDPIGSIPQTEDFALLSNTGSLMSGVVRDRNTHAPISGAQVFFYGTGYGTVMTNANGEYSFTGSNLTLFGGEVSGALYVGTDGYFEAPAVSVSDLAAQSSLPLVNDVTLRSSGPLVTGIITNASNSMPIAGATISFNRNPMSTFRGGATTVSVMSANDGSYLVDASYFAESMSNSYQINLMINAPGYLGTTRNASIASIPQSENFALTPGAN